MRSLWDESVFCTPFLPIASLETLMGQGEDGEPVPITCCIPDPAADVEAAYEAKETARAIASFVASLAPRPYEAVRRVFWEEQAQSVVARELGISGAAISKLLAKVRLTGRRRLAHYRHSTLLS